MDELEKLKEKLNEELSIAESNLNSLYEELHQPCTSKEHRKFCLLKVQAAIVQFELCSGLLQYVMAQYNCFASKVALKGLIHIIFEYKKSLKSHHIKTLMDLCDSKNFDSEKEKLTLLTKQYKEAISQIDQFRNLRNKATGHYEDDIEKQVSLIESLSEDDCLELLKKFNLFHKEILKSLRRIGRKQ